jgi:predicted site-specific integrase-resolvase
MTPLVVDTKAAASALGVSVWVLRRYIADGLLPTVKFPSTERPGEDFRRVLIAVADLEAFVVKHREVATP